MSAPIPREEPLPVGEAVYHDRRERLLDIDQDEPLAIVRSRCIEPMRLPSSSERMAKTARSIRKLCRRSWCCCQSDVVSLLISKDSWNVHGSRYANK